MLMFHSLAWSVPWRWFLPLVVLCYVAAGFHFSTMCLGNAELLEHQEDPCNLEHAAGSWKLRTWCYCCCLFPLWTGESVFGVFIKVSQGCRLSVWMLLSQTLHTVDSEHLLSYFYLNLTSSQTFITFSTSAVERDTAAMLSAMNITLTLVLTRCDAIRF